MAQRQITELPTATTPDGSELLLVRQDVYDKKLDVNSLLAYLQSVLDDRYLNESLNLSDVAAVQTAFDNIKQAATESYKGVVELATVAEAIAGVDTTRAVTPKGLFEAILQNVPQATYTAAGKVELATPAETKAGVDSTRAVTPEGIKAILDDMFCGQVSAFAMGVAPEGWLKCNGAAVSRTTYAKLFSKIGTTYGVGNGSTTFNLPDLRGEFVRGFDDTRGVDSGRILGSTQAQSIQSHSHTGSTESAGGHTHGASTGTNGDHNHSGSTTSDGNHRHTAQNVNAEGSELGFWYYAERGRSSSVHQPDNAVDDAGSHTHSLTTNTTGSHSHSVSVTSAGSHAHNFTTNNTGSAETRPRNVALLYCIKY